MGKDVKFYRPQFDMSNPEDREFIELVKLYSKKWGMTCPTVIKKIGLLQLKGLMHNTSLPGLAGVELPPGFVAGINSDNSDMIYENDPAVGISNKPEKVTEAAPAANRKQKSGAVKEQEQAAGNEIVTDMSDQELDRFFNGLDEG